MKLQTRKIIAREFLLLIISLLLGFMTFCVTYIYNSIQQRKVTSLTDFISTKSGMADSLSKSFREFESKSKNQEFIIKSYTEDGLPILKNVNTMYYLEESDVVKLYNIITQMTNIGKTENEIEDVVTDFKNENAIQYDSLSDPFGIELPKNAHLFHLDKNKKLSKMDSLNYQKYLSIKSEIKLSEAERRSYNSKIMNFDKRVKLSMTIFLFSCMLLFIVRYVVYGIIWSIKTLRQKT